MPEITGAGSGTPFPQDPSIPPRMNKRSPACPTAPIKEVRAAIQVATENGFLFYEAFAEGKLEKLRDLFAEVQPALSEIAEAVRLPLDYPQEKRDSTPPGVIASSRSFIYRRPYTWIDLEEAYRAALTQVQAAVESKVGEYVGCFYEASWRALQERFFAKVGLPTDKRLTFSLRETADKYTLEQLAAKLAALSPSAQRKEGDPTSLPKGRDLGQASGMLETRQEAHQRSGSVFPEWKYPIGLNPQERAVTFETVEERDRAIDLIWNPSEALYRVPFGVGDRQTLIFPSEAIPLLAEKGLKFREGSEARSMEAAGFCDLTDAEIITHRSRWKSHLKLYREERAVTFETVEERDRAIDLIWNPSEALYRVPFGVGDRQTLIFPSEAIPLLAEKGLKFRVSNVRSS